MQVVEKSSEGLSRVFEVTVAKDILASKLDAKIKDIAPKMNIKGFRPG
ncbi:MAG: trigger factor family protein, partial [Asticcacaulis sp.]